ncbi:MAG: hypothetical protein DWQ07_02095 [Chloroflexi bacterium]|nr:MAG: hypothetical protein DWQ07_02095 [Chloroflexota bacterium]MBL1193711.1 hypothetical protein [Chloroflexota bacterium]NOH11004.1 hypothetical protein [Chloroflexota bacterium]
MVLNSVEDAESSIEISDFYYEYLKHYDSQGNLLKMNLVTEDFEKKFLFFHWRQFGRVVRLSQYDPNINEAKELKAHLIEFLCKYKEGSHGHLERYSLLEVIQETSKHNPRGLGPIDFK